MNAPAGDGDPCSRGAFTHLLVSRIPIAQLRHAVEYNPDACPANFGADTMEPAPVRMPRGEVAGIAVGVSAVVLGLAVALAFVVFKKTAARRRLRGPPDPASADTTYAMTDIQDSTKLWESLPAEAMGRAMVLHNDCLRAALKECQGYLSFTEGDAFFVAFHSVQDAVRWALLVQERLLDLAWPAELLAHPSASVAHGEASSGEGGRALLFRGLRVRVGLHCQGEGGLGADGAPPSRATSAARGYQAKIIFSGPAPSLCRTVCDAGEGGAILITGSSFAKLSEEFSDAMQPFHCGTYLLPVVETPEGAGHVKEPLVLVEPLPLAGRVHGFSRTLRVAGPKLSDHCLDAPRGDVTIAFTYFPAAEALLAFVDQVGADCLDVSPDHVR